MRLRGLLIKPTTTTRGIRVIRIKTVNPSTTLHSKRRSCRFIKDTQLLLGKPPRQEKRAHRDERHDEYGEPHGGDSLRDGKSSTEADELDGDEEPNGTAAANLEERVVRGREGLVAPEEEQLVRDAVGLEGLDAHDEEETGENAVGDEVQTDQKRPRHGAEC